MPGRGIASWVQTGSRRSKGPMPLIAFTWVPRDVVPTPQNNGVRGVAIVGLIKCV